MIAAALFDFGGVLTAPILPAVDSFYRTHGISDDARAGVSRAWSLYERSEVTTAEFTAIFDEHARSCGSRLTGDEFMDWLVGSFPPRREMIAVVEHLRGRVRLGLITNNVAPELPPERRYAGLPVGDLFETVADSAIVRISKPDPRIFRIACDALGVEPHQAVFLDDMDPNLEGAKSLGMTTIKVDHTLRAIDELEAALGIPLPRP